jgi:hypothetical protein
MDRVEKNSLPLAIENTWQILVQLPDLYLLLNNDMEIIGNSKELQNHAIVSFIIEANRGILREYLQTPFNDTVQFTGYQLLPFGDLWNSGFLVIKIEDDICRPNPLSTWFYWNIKSGQNSADAHFEKLTGFNIQDVANTPDFLSANGATIDNLNVKEYLSGKRAKRNRWLEL